jgi:hypothetical protein
MAGRSKRLFMAADLARAGVRSRAGRIGRPPGGAQIPHPETCTRVQRRTKPAQL